MDEELIAAYASLFVHQWNAYAVQQRNGAYWRVAESLTLSHLHAHLMGHWTLGTYLLDAQSCCAFAVFDADSDDGVERLAALSLELARCGVTTLLEASRRGSHLWVHLTQVTPAILVRAWLLPYAQDFGVELYPKQDVLSCGGSGSLIRLPLGVHRKSWGWYPFLRFTPEWGLVPVGQTVVECCAWAVANVERVRVPHTVMVPIAPFRQDVAPVPARTVQEVRSIREWCHAQDIFAVIGSYVVLNSQGVGSCPFKEHHHHADVHPSFQVFGGNDPHWYCYTWHRAGNVFDFLCLYHQLTVQEGWQRVQAGTLY